MSTYGDWTAWQRFLVYGSRLLVWLPTLGRVRVEGLDRVSKRPEPDHRTRSSSSRTTPATSIRRWSRAGSVRKLRRGSTVLAKEELFHGPLGPFLRRSGMVMVRTGGSDIDAYRVTKAVLDRGDVILLFPEGTRSPTGIVGKGHAGVAMLAAREGVRVLPVGLSGTDLLLGRGPDAGHGSARRLTIRVSVSRSCSPWTRPCPVARRSGGQRRGHARISDLVDERQRGDVRTRASHASRLIRSRGRQGRRTRRSPPLPRPPSTHARRCQTRGCDTRSVMGTVEQVRVARRTGFCYGVREAIDHARTSAAEGKETLTLGQTVHNEGVISDLRARGIRTVESLDAVEPGTSVVIRAHGVTPEIMETAQSRGLDVIDGTCSWVVQEHREVAKLVEEGYTIVLLGTPYHPEVVGILGYAPDAIVVDEEEEWERIPKTKRMALVSQSTQPPWKFQKLAALMVSRAHELKIVNTVCPVTIRRQEDTIELAAAGGHDGRRRWPELRQHPGAHPPGGHRPQARGPGRARGGADRPVDLRGVPHGGHHGRHVDPHRGPRGRHPAGV